MSSVSNRTLEDIKQELKKLLLGNLSLEGVTIDDVTNEMPLFGAGGLGLDSLDGVEIVVLLQRQYGLDVKDMQKGREIFLCINTLAPYVLQHAVK